MVLSHRDKGDPTLFGMEEDLLGDMRKEFDGWDSQYATSPPPFILFFFSSLYLSSKHETEVFSH